MSSAGGSRRRNRLVCYFGGFFIMTLGIFLYVPADLMPLAGEGAMLAISQVSGVAFSTVKILFDCSMVTISLVTCLVMLHALGVWTAAAAVLVGVVLKGITKVLGKRRDAWLGCSAEQPCAE